MDRKIIIQNLSQNEILQTIAKLREQKGKENEVLRLIDEISSSDYKFITNLLFEKALTYQHLYINDNSDKNSISGLNDTILKAKEYVEKYKLIDLKSRLFIFLGKIADIKGQYKDSILNYTKSGKSLESRGHLAYSLIMDGQLEKGYKLARETYDDFFITTEGNSLKKNDYDTWVIWMSGIVIRTIKALIDKKTTFDLVEVRNWLTETETYLDHKEKYSYRKAEIKKLWIKIKNYKNL